MNRINLLVADDEQLECDAVELLVSKCGYDISVLKAYNGREAVEKARTYRPCIIFLDIQMPRMNGLEAAEQIRAFMPGCFIVFLTAWGRFEFAQKAVQLKADEYLLKPIDQDKMKEILDGFFSLLKENNVPASDEKNSIYENMTLQQKTEQLQKAVLSGDLNKSLVAEQEVLHTLYETYGRSQQAAHALYELLSIFCFEVSKNVPFLYYDKPVIEDCLLLETFFSSFINNVCGAVQSDKRDKYERIFTVITGYIASHYMNQISVDSIAEQFNIHSVYFSQLFRKYCGKTFVEYLTDVRMKEAARLLSGGWSVKNTSQSAGFTDTNYFSKVFRRYYNCSPSEYANSKNCQEKK